MQEGGEECLRPLLGRTIVFFHVGEAGGGGLRLPLTVSFGQVVQLFVDKVSLLSPVCSSGSRVMGRRCRAQNEHQTMNRAQQHYAQPLVS